MSIIIFLIALYLLFTGSVGPGIAMLFIGFFLLGISEG